MAGRAMLKVLAALATFECKVREALFLCLPFFNVAACSLMKGGPGRVAGGDWLGGLQWMGVRVPLRLSQTQMTKIFRQGHSLCCDMYLAFAGFLAFAFACTAHQRKRNGKASQRMGK